MQTIIPFIAIDDNPIDLLLLTEYAKEFDFLHNLGTFTNVKQGLVAIEKLQPQLVFLDIEMPDQTGLEILQKINKIVPFTIFITSHLEYAVNGFELSAFDYIVKPLTAQRLQIVANRINDAWQLKQKAAAYEVLFEQEMLTIKEGHTQVKLPQSEIIYLEAMQDYTKVVTANKNYLTLTTLTNFLEKLTPNKFMRVHRSYAIAVNKITALHSNSITCGTVIIPIGKTYKNIMSSIQL